MTKRQSLINKAARSLAKGNALDRSRFNIEIKVIEFVTDHDEEYATTATDKQWDRFSSEVIRDATQIRNDRLDNEAILAMMTPEELAAIEAELGI
ncbi:MAG TPA: hypothetical protein ENI05_03810 [Porticoccus sp.]|nr:hypothetical protein [Porticoccus sp.]